MRWMIRSQFPYLWVYRQVRAPALEAWRVLIDTEYWPLWGPSVRAVACPEPRIALGTSGRIQTALGFWLPFQVTAFDSNRMSWRWRVGGVAATGHRVLILENGGTLVGFQVPFVAAPYLLICAMALRRIARLLERAGDRR